MSDKCGFVCHSCAHCSYALAHDFSFWLVAERTFQTSSSLCMGYAHSAWAWAVVWQKPGRWVSAVPVSVQLRW